MKVSWTMAVSGVFIGYICYSIYTFAQLFRSLKCSDEMTCYHSFLNAEPKMQLALFTSPSMSPISTDVKKITNIRNFDYREPYTKWVKLEFGAEQNNLKNFFSHFKIDVPLKTRRNGTLYLYVVLAVDDGSLEWKEFQRDGPTVINRVSLTQYVVPREATFNLLNEENPNEHESKKKILSDLKTKTHIKTKVFVTVLTDRASMSPQDVAPELARMVRVSRKHEFLPMIQSNVLKERFTYLVEVNKNVTEVDLEFNYSPSSVGKFRLIAHIENTMSQLTTLGFAPKDVDQVKEIFAEANLYLLCGTLFIGSIHVSLSGNE